MEYKSWKYVLSAVSSCALPLIFSTVLAAQTMCPSDSLAFKRSTQICETRDLGEDEDPGPAVPVASNLSNQHDWVHAWMRRADKARASQPQWVAPIVTTRVSLTQQFRYDITWQESSRGDWTENYGSGKGLEIIPATRLEVAIVVPPYFVHQSSAPDGFGDLSFLVKFRAFSAPERKGNYFVGFFFGISVQTGNPPNGAGHTLLSPTLALGKGWGKFNIQNTFGVNLPTSGTDVLGRAILLNSTIEYKIKKNIWPMLEANSTFWSGGNDAGKKQTFLTPGIVLGLFPLVRRLRVGFGAGVQIPVTRYHTYNRRWIFSVRLPF